MTYTCSAPCSTVSVSVTITVAVTVTAGVSVAVRVALGVAVAMAVGAAEQAPLELQHGRGRQLAEESVARAGVVLGVVCKACDSNQRVGGVCIPRDCRNGVRPRRAASRLPTASLPGDICCPLFLPLPVVFSSSHCLLSSLPTPGLLSSLPTLATVLSPITACWLLFQPLSTVHAVLALRSSSRCLLCTQCWRCALACEPDQPLSPPARSCRCNSSGGGGAAAAGCRLGPPPRPVAGFSALTAAATAAAGRSGVVMQEVPVQW